MDHPLHENSWHDNPELAKWIPFIGPGAAVMFLIVAYLIFYYIFEVFK